MTGLSRIVSVGAGACLVAACAASEPEPNSQFQAGQQMQQQPQQQYPQQQQPQQQYPQQQQPQQQYPQQQQPQQQQPGALPTTLPTAIPTTLPPMALPIPNAAVGSPAQPLDASMGAAAQPILNNLANTSAPGAKAVGGAMVGMFQTGQQLETAITLQPGKCYTVIAAGLPTVTEVNVQLILTMPVATMNPVLAQDQTTGPQAVLAGAPNCYKWLGLLPAAAKVFTSVAAGQGIAAVQVYEK